MSASTSIAIECRNVQMQPEWETRINEEFARVQRHYPRGITSGRVEIIGTRHHRHGAYEVRLVVTVPNDTVVVTRRGDLEFPLLTDVFDALQRQLEERARMVRGDVKRHESHVHGGTVIRLQPKEGFGFLRPAEPDSVDVYFHRHCVRNGAFPDLKVGLKVKYGVEEGDKGPQATWVRVE